MRHWIVLLSVCVVLCVSGGMAGAQQSSPSGAAARTDAPAGTLWSDLAGRETLTGGWFGLGERLADRGVEAGLGLTQVYQINARGGRATGRHAGRYTGSYDLEFSLDLAKLCGLPGGHVHALVEGSWSSGLDDSSVGSLLGINDDAGGDEAVFVSQLFYEQAFLGGQVVVRAGKIDLTSPFFRECCVTSFDGNAFANSETDQFLSSALVNNPTIPLPEEGLGVMAEVCPAPWLYLAAGVSDADADAREMGTNTAFHGRDSFFSIYEFGLMPKLPSPRGDLRGTYRAGFWYDPQPKDRASGTTKRDDMGWYVSFDQMLFRERDDADATQGLGAFFRYGYAHGDVAEMHRFWSAGLHYQGLLPGRDDDVLAVGFAHGRVGKRWGFVDRHETVLEVYYNLHLLEWMQISPHFQHVCHPGADGGVAKACVFGVRVQMSF